MIDNLTLADLLRVLAWAFFGGLPLFFAYSMALEAENKDEGLKAFLFWSCFAAQLAFGIAAYLAGKK